MWKDILTCGKHESKPCELAFVLIFFSISRHRLRDFVFSALDFGNRACSFYMLTNTTLNCLSSLLERGRRGGPMVNELDSGSSGPGSSPGRGHCVVLLGKTLNSHSASLHPGV